MSRTAAPIMLSDQERIDLQTWARLAARSQAQRVVQRAQIILLAAVSGELLREAIVPAIAPYPVGVNDEIRETRCD